MVDDCAADNDGDEGLNIIGVSVCLSQNLSSPRVSYAAKASKVQRTIITTTELDVSRTKAS